MKKFFFFLLILLLVGCGNMNTIFPANEENKQIDLTTDLTVHYIDAGQADATLFQYKHEDTYYHILYDAGDWNKNDVVTYLQDQQIELIDLVIISHPHADHIGQLPGIMEAFDVGEVWMSGNTVESGVFTNSLEAVTESDTDYYEPRAGEVFQIGPMEIEVLHPTELTGGLNEDSISVRFTYGEISFLFTGDAYKKQELMMIDNNKTVKANFLHLGHHGSNTSTSPDFLKVVDPEVVIYSAGQDNSYGHPHMEVIQQIQEAEIILYGTDMDGTIIVSTDGKEYVIDTIETKANVNKKPETKPKEEICIDINQASPKQLQEIIHIGEGRAEAIIESRPYKSLDELMKINGISEGRLKDIEEQGLACVGG